MRYFFSTGEASGEMSATLLAGALRGLDPRARFEGIGNDRMREFGFSLVHHTRGWGSMGIYGAIARAPKLYTIMWMTALRLVRDPPDLIVLVDFGAFNLRLAKTLRLLGYRKAILYFFPPGAWLDKPAQAAAVARWTTPLVAFEHQRDFYRAVGLPVFYFGHPLPSAYTMRAPRAAPPRDGGRIAILPGSRQAELRYHLPVLADAVELLRARRPNLRVTFGAADSLANALIERETSRRGLRGFEIVRTASAALTDADAAWIASGTAVLESALCGVPSIALYILSAAQARLARKIYRGPYITIPNLVLKKPVIAEFLQDRATPENLAAAMDELLADPGAQYEQLRALRGALGPADALEQCARFALQLAGA